MDIRRGWYKAAFFLCALLISCLTTSISTTATAASVIPQTIGTRLGRQQFGIAASGSIAVWEDRAIADLQKTATTPFARPSNLGTSDIRGFNFATNRPIIVTTARGDQSDPAISGSIVVWEDTR